MCGLQAGGGGVVAPDLVLLAVVRAGDGIRVGVGGDAEDLREKGRGEKKMRDSGEKDASGREGKQGACVVEWPGLACLPIPLPGADPGRASQRARAAWEDRPTRQGPTWLGEQR